MVSKSNCNGISYLPFESHENNNALPWGCCKIERKAHLLELLVQVSNVRNLVRITIWEPVPRKLAIVNYTKKLQRVNGTLHVVGLAPKDDPIQETPRTPCHAQGYTFPIALLV